MPRPPRGVCSIEDCTRPHNARGWCAYHYRRWMKTGDPLSVGVWGAPRRAAPSYYAVHKRLRTDRGSARNYSCERCSKIAAGWAYTHGDPNELTDPATGFPYSAGQDYYVPLCKSCHSTFDYERKKQAA